MNYILQNGREVESETYSKILESLMELRPHSSMTYTWDDMGMSELLVDVYHDEIKHCPNNDCWYLWDNCWERQTDDGKISDMIQTVMNALMLYCNEISETEGEEIIKGYRKYIMSIRNANKIKNIMQVFKTACRMSLKDMDSNPYILNTPRCAYNLKTGEVVENIREFNVTKKTRCNMPSILDTTCIRWYEFIDQITSGKKEKAAFLQRALGYSLLGVNREECMFMAYGSKTRNGKGTLFSTIASVLGEDYADSAPTELICESKNGKSVDFNGPQPALAKLVGTRLVSMAESSKDVRLDAAAMKTMTGRDTLVTRGLFQNSFSFVPQFTLWLNTNHLPAVTDDTVFSSNRIHVITFDEHFEGDSQDKDLKETFSLPENKPTILKWLVDGCNEYMRHGLNPPSCVIEATEQYRKMHDRIGCFIEECCEIGLDNKIQRGALYSKYTQWCMKPDNKYKPMGSTTFYSEMSMRGYPVKKISDWYIVGITTKEDKCLSGID